MGKCFHKFWTEHKDMLLPLFLIVFVLICTLSKPVNKFVDSVLPRESITITAAGDGTTMNEIWLLNSVVQGDSRANLIFSSEERTENGLWEYRKAEEYGYFCDVIVSYGENQGASLSIQAPMKSNGYIAFQKGPQVHSVTITVGPEEYALDLYAEVAAVEKFYPFAQSMLPVIARILTYCGSFLLLSLAAMAVIAWLDEGRRCPEVLKNNVKKRHIIYIWALLYIWAVAQYRVGIPNFLQFGDQNYYWSEILGQALWDEKGWHPVEFASIDGAYTFRGYVCHVIPILSHWAGGRLGIDPILIYFMFTTLAIAWLTAYILPELYELLTDKRGTVFQMLVFLLLYLVFWNGTVTAVLVDMFGAVCFISGLTFAVKFLRKWKVCYALLSGTFWALACSYRTAYQYGILCLLLIAVGRHLFQRHKQAKKIPCDKKRIKAVGIGVTCAIGMFILISVPQMQINYERGYVGLLPSGTVNSWESQLQTKPNSAKTSLLQGSMNGSIMGAYTGWPMAVSDDQMITMKTEIFEREDFLTVPQILSVYANNPVDTLAYLGKKLLIAFDTKTSITYPNSNEIKWRETSGLLFSFFNFFVLMSAGYALFFGRSVKLEEKLLATGFIFGLILPQMVVHVEWRYFLSSYILLYYFFAYHFVFDLVTGEGNVKLDKKYLWSLFWFILIAFIISMTVCA